MAARVSGEPSSQEQVVDDSWLHELAANLARKQRQAALTLIQAPIPNSPHCLTLIQAPHPQTRHIKDLVSDLCPWHTLNTVSFLFILEEETALSEQSLSIALRLG